ncbi:hypothetical protein [Nocardioides sp. SR21]|uniref:hypothetical protein n=1 Tax=Nocardioides sp. SR21 TaxID=2919501 RepID=UPI001FAA476E|nr:hypothetical protein [Nocardioides sp. SR21]
MPRQDEVCTVKHRTIETEDRCPRRHPDGIREQHRRAQEAVAAPQPRPDRPTPQENYDRNLLKFAREQAAMTGFDLSTLDRPEFDWWAKAVGLSRRDAQFVWDHQPRRSRGRDTLPRRDQVGGNRAREAARPNDAWLDRQEEQRRAFEAQRDHHAADWQAYVIAFHAWADQRGMTRSERVEALSTQGLPRHLRQVVLQQQATGTSEPQPPKRPTEQPTPADIEWADRWRPRIRRTAGVVVALVLAAFLFTAVLGDAQDDPSTSEADGSSDSSTALSPAERREQRRVRAQEAKADCLKERGAGATMRTCGGDRYVTCDNAAHVKYEGSGEYKGTTIVCDENNFVAVAWDSDDDHAFKRIWYAGRWIGRAVSPGHGTRQAKPAPKPAPEPYVPPAPTPDYSDDSDSSSGDDLSGYTGPRCYAPGGKTWTPC